MRKLSSIACGLIAMTMLSTGCRDLTDDDFVTPGSAKARPSGKVELGEPFEPSWSLESMRVFYDAMVEAYPERNFPSSDEAILVSHYYVKFLPQDTQQYDSLKGLGIDLYPYPLHLKFAETEGEPDPGDGTDQIDWQYAIVTKGTLLPDFVEHEILQETYMPLDVEVAKEAAGQPRTLLEGEVSVGEYLEMCAVLDNNLVDGAMIENGLFDSLYYDTEDPENGAGKTTGKKWKLRLWGPVKTIVRAARTVRNTIVAINIVKWGPKGKIQVQYIHPSAGGTVTEGVANIEVVARYGLTNRSTFTKTDGSYSFNFPTLAPCWFNLKFQNNNVTLRFKTGILTAMQPGPVTALNQGWNFTATASDEWAYVPS